MSKQYKLPKFAAAYQVKYELNKNRFKNVSPKIYLKWEVPNIAKRMAKTNQDNFREQCISNDDGMLTVKDDDKKIA